MEEDEFLIKLEDYDYDNDQDEHKVNLVNSDEDLNESWSLRKD